LSPQDRLPVTLRVIMTMVAAKCFDLLKGRLRREK
jgi:hypothetical protein